MTEPRELPTLIPAGSDLAKSMRPLLRNMTRLPAKEVQAFQEMDKLLREAADQAEALIETATKEAEIIKEAAIEEGNAEGLARWLDAITAANEEYNRVQREAERDMVTLAFHIARRLIGHSIDVEPMLIRDLVGASLQAARGRRQIVVKVHPEDLPTLESARMKLQQDLDCTHLHFEAFGEIERGGCLIETEAGRIDARIETRLDTLYTALLEES